MVDVYKCDREALETTLPTSLLRTKFEEIVLSSNIISILSLNLSPSLGSRPIQRMNSRQRKKTPKPRGGFQPSHPALEPHCKHIVHLAHKIHEGHSPRVHRDARSAPHRVKRADKGASLSLLVRSAWGENLSLAPESKTPTSSTKPQATNPQATQAMEDPYPAAAPDGTSRAVGNHGP